MQTQHAPLELELDELDELSEKHVIVGSSAKHEPFLQQEIKVPPGPVQSTIPPVQLATKPGIHKTIPFTQVQHAPLELELELEVTPPEEEEDDDDDEVR